MRMRSCDVVERRAVCGVGVDGELYVELSQSSIVKGICSLMFWIEYNPDMFYFILLDLWFVYFSYSVLFGRVPRPVCLPCPGLRGWCRWCTLRALQRVSGRSVGDEWALVDVQ